MKQFDFDKVEDILKEENKKRKILNAELYLCGDEFWNATTIISNGKFMKNKWFICFGGSYWATPMLRIEFLIDNELLNKEFVVCKDVDDFDGHCVKKWLNETNIYKELGLEVEEEDE